MTRLKNGEYVRHKFLKYIPIMQITNLDVIKGLFIGFYFNVVSGLFEKTALLSVDDFELVDFVNSPSSI